MKDVGFVSCQIPSNGLPPLTNSCASPFRTFGPWLSSNSEEHSFRVKVLKTLVIMEVYIHLDS